MTTAHAFHGEHKRLKPFIDLALKEGWKVVHTSGGNLRFIKQGLPAIYTGSTALRRPGNARGFSANG